ncbi:hypothetical protein SAMN06265360_12265 [Haloechinothrix alba]|uniref:Uncharacterized protein n=1 Tax=Haloechinothrix alba TaxID=664784 RepID=A0A238ZNZ6_9PSEU|nr:hypothetical protein [Haloechinothrix alba]SNR84434.1 hypothetical protein SAMN06265360_12265 [Haloechinothrix alba]
MTAEAKGVTEQADAGEHLPNASVMLGELRALAEHSPTRARTETWSYLRALGERNDHDALSHLFGAGTEPRNLDGKLEGQIVGKLFGIPEAKLANQLMRIDPTWRGKSFDLAAGTGLNRLSPIALVAMPIVTFGYLGLRKVGRESEGFHFNHSVDQGLIEPRVTVRALDYGVPQYKNPGVRTFPIRKTRDEIVELTPGVYLGRALLFKGSDEIRPIAYFALRHPVGSPL